MIESIGRYTQQRIDCCPAATMRSSYPGRATFALLPKARAPMRKWWVQARLIPMGALQRIVAVIILLAFLPTSIAAALPLVYCIGADGHRAVEYLNGSEHDHSHPRSTNTEAAGHQSPCVDLELAPVANVVRSDVKVSSFVSAGAAPPIAALISSIGITNDPLWTRLRYLGSRAGMPVDYLAAHRTTVLII